ncbi:MAG: pyridoxamine 5-phosphate oxidase family protein [Actinomycetia bacterium]|jgi:nitroimidazol reductase NimA-like FMN-containing flavoprotein (pyridoxamine 5'-phosphate oxidase superfamily)|nr:pyridoxamine 5-phosphate oxidase family protein [Actinomycetes bacterium]
MTTPVTVPQTALDQRFSDPAAAATSWEATRHALETAELFWISTVRADGRPHVTPLVAVWDDGALYFCTGGAEQKALNLAANPHVVLTTGCNGWEGGLDVMVEGEAVRVTDDGTLGRLARAWAAKWDGRWHFEVRDGAFHPPGGENPALVFAVAPAKVLAFTKGTFTHTRHRF